MIKATSKELLIKEFKLTDTFFKENYKPWKKILKYIESPKDLFFISAIISLLGYDWEKEENGFNKIWKQLELEKIIIKNWKINYNLKELERLFWTQKNIINYFQKPIEEIGFGTHIYELWNAKFNKVTNIGKKHKITLNIEVDKDFLNKFKFENNKSREFDYIFERVWKKNAKMNKINDLGQHEIFTKEFFKILNYIKEADFFHNSKTNYSFSLIYKNLIKEKNKEGEVNFNWFWSTFFFDFIKISYFINKEKNNLVEFKDELDTTDEVFKGYSKGVSWNIKEWIKKVFESKNMEIFENFKNLYTFFEDNLKENDKYKKLSKYEKIIYIESMLCCIGKDN